VHVIVRNQRGLGLRRFSAIDRERHLHAALEHAIGIVRIHAYLAEVQRTRIVRAHLVPCRAAVVGAIETAFAVCGSSATAAPTPPAPPPPPAASTATAGLHDRGVNSLATASTTAAWRGGPFDGRVDEVAVLAIRVEPDATERTGRDAVRQARPGVAGVD